MSSEQLNQDIRRFLKRFGVAAHHAIQEAVDQGTLSPGTTAHARAHLVVEGLDIDLVIEENLQVGDEEGAAPGADTATPG